jgi:hypothetical protein
MASRKIEDCVPELQALYGLFLGKMGDAHLHFTITCTARTVLEQVALYAQGREKLERTNYLRLLAKLPPIDRATNRRKVTWTLHSKHLIDLDDGITTNDQSRAFDFAMLDANGKITWNLKIDVMYDQIPDYQQAGEIGESCGLVWGGRFKTLDMCHFELKDG